MKPTVGFIGLGLMGAPMAARLHAAGYSLHVHNRTKEKASSLISKGAVWKNSPAECAADAAVVFSMVTNDTALGEVAASIQTALREGGIHVDCSTVSPKLTSSLENAYEKSGRYFLHSPVLGSIPQATDGSLLLFVGGKEIPFRKVEPMLSIIGSKVWRFDTAAQASNTKLIMNSFITGMAATLAQALVFASKANINGATILEILSHSALNAPTIQVKGKSILERNFTPRFIVQNLLKDTNLFLDEAAALNADAPIASTVKNVLEQTIALGFGREDYSALIKALEARSGISS